MLSQGLGIAIHLTSTVVLARTLSPRDYGVVAMVLSVTGIAALFRDLGLSSAAIQKSKLTDAQQSNLFWLNVMMGAILTLTVAASAPLVAGFYRNPALIPVTVALSLNFLIGSFGTQHAVRLVREMQFVRKSTASLAGALVGLVVSITLAVNEYSYWALVWGNLAGSLCTTIGLFLLSPFWPGLPSRGTGIRDMLKFGANVTGFEFVNYFHRNLDNILIGRVWGPAQLGLYSRAYNLLMFPITNIRGPINTVAYPALSKLQNDPAGFRTYYRKVTSIVAFLSMPLCAFLFVASAPVIEIALGKQWLEIVPIFAVLAITGFIQPVASLRGLVMLSMRRSKAYLTWGIFNAVAVSLGFLCGIHWGPTGVAVSYAIVSYLILYPSLVLAFKDTPLQKRDFLLPILRPMAASVFAVIVTSLTTGKMPLESAFLRLAVSGVIFGLSYVLGYCATEKGRKELSWYIRLRHQLKNARKGRRRQESPAS